MFNVPSLLRHSEYGVTHDACWDGYFVIVAWDFADLIIFSLFRFVAFCCDYSIQVYMLPYHASFCSGVFFPNCI
jgi:hypothetical protein